MSDAAEHAQLSVEEPNLQLVEATVTQVVEQAVAELVEILPVEEEAMLPPHRRPGQIAPRGGYSEDGVAQYLNEISSHPLIKREDEVRLAKQIEAGRDAQAKLDSWANYPEQEVDRQEQLRAQRAVRFGEAAKQDLINANLRLVVSVARKYTVSSGMPFLDLIQEGNLGLMHAVDKFDWHKGFKFSTYATFWIKQAVQSAIADSSRLVRVPRNISDNMSQLTRTEKYFQSINETPDDEALADWLGWDEEKLARVRAAFIYNQTPSLNAEVGEDESIELGDFISDPNAEAAFQHNQRRTDLGASLIAALHELDSKERDIIISRYGLLDGQNKTLEEVGKEYGVTRERIRQLETRARAALRRHQLLAGALDYIKDDDF